jgi:hypothetical protein
MVIIDPLYLTMPGINLSQSHEVGPLLQWLMALRHNYNCAVVLVHHWAKANDNTKMRRSGQRLLGTGFFHGWLESGLYVEKLEGDDALRVKVEREFRNVAPMGDLEIAWHMGEPGELDMNVEIYNWNQEGQIVSAIERLLPTVSAKGLNLKVVAEELSMDKKDVALAARAAGYRVKRVKYSRGYAYVIYPEAS